MTWTRGGSCPAPGGRTTTCTRTSRPGSPPRAQTVLDVGGGTGNLARLLPSLSIRCVLLDLSPGMLALAPRPAVLADGATLPVADARVDAVAALYTLYHYDDPLLPVGEARRVLRPGGR